VIQKNSDLGRFVCDLVLKLLPRDFPSLIYTLGEFQVIWSCIPSGTSFIRVPATYKGVTPLVDSVVGGVSLGRWD